jgi:hypothetical protein
MAIINVLLMNQEVLLASQQIDTLMVEFKEEMTPSDKMILQSMKEMILKGPLLMLLTPTSSNSFIDKLRKKNEFAIQLYQGNIKSSLNILEHALTVDPRHYVQSTILSNVLLLKEVESENSPFKVAFRRQLAEKIAHHGSDELRWSILSSHL